MCDDCVNDLFNADLLRDMLLKCNEVSDEIEEKHSEMFYDQPLIEHEEKFKVPPNPVDDVKPIFTIMYKCHNCTEEFETMQYLNEHLAHEHSYTKPVKVSKTPKQTPDEVRYVCHRCNTHVKRLPHHMRTVHPNDPLEFKCKYCEKICNKISTLQSHMHDQHRAAQVCDECGASFKRKSRLIDHKASIHLKIKEFICDYCNAKFARRCGLVCHIRSHTGVKPFKCKYCPKVS